MMNFRRFYLSVTLLLLAGLTPSVVSATAPTGCGNGNSGGLQSPTNGFGDPVAIYTGNEYRDVNDLQIWGGAGHHQLTWSRHASSRVSTIPSTTFGEGHDWRHSYQWSLTTAGVDSQGRKKVTVSEPTGSLYTFTQTAPAQWSGAFACPTQLIPQGTGFIYQTPEGYRYHFTYTASGTSGYYLMRDFTDDTGCSFTLSYNSAKQVTSITEPAGRSLSVTYRTITDTTDTLDTLAVATTNALVTYNAPPPLTDQSGGSGGSTDPLSSNNTTDTIPPVTPPGSVPAVPGWIVLPVHSATPYRYVRVLSADGSCGNMAEVQFFDKSGNPLTGTIISSDPALAPNAFDGNTNTGFISASQSGSYVGYDLGSAKEIGSVRILPMAGQTAAMFPTQWGMKSLIVQGCNVAPSSLTVIDHVSTSDGRSVQYHYTPFLDPVLGINYPTLTSVLYGDGTSASYTYHQLFGGTTPLITEYNDVRCTTRQQHSQTVYQNGAASVLGMVDHQVNPSTGGTILTLGNAGNVHTPTATFANGGTTTQLMLGGVVAWTRDANGKQTGYTYDTNTGFQTKMTDPLGHVTTYARDSFGSVLTQTNADGSVESFTRNSLNAVTSYTDTLGQVTTWTRDASNRVTGVAYPDGSGEAFGYNGFAEVSSHTLRSGGTENFSYDARGLLRSKTDALGNVTSYGYDSADRLNSVTDANGNTTTMVYSERGLVTQITYPDGSSRHKTYNASGDLISDSNELGNTWNYSYDPTFHLLLSVTDPLDRTTQYAYAPDCSESSPLSITLPSGKQSTLHYDLEWHLLNLTVGAGSPDAATTTFVYDNDYNVVRKIDGNNQNWNFTYDKRNRKLSATDPLGHATKNSYDAAGNLLTVTRPDLKVTTNAYDSMRRLTRSTDPMGNVTSFGYDASGNVSSLTDAKGNVYAYSYDLLSRKLTMSYPNGTQELWSYDGVGNMETYTTRAGQTATYTYDERNRNIGYTWSDATPAVERTYDAAGRLLTLSNSASVIGYAYDAANQLLSETQAITGQVPHSIGYSYDVDGNRMSMAYPTAWQVAYSYNGRNLPSSISSGVNTSVASFSYDGNGNRISKTLGNGVVATYGYDAASRLIGDTNALAGSGLVAGYSYSLDNLGRRTSRTEATALASRKDSYGYDPLSQLTNVAYASGTKVGYAYDPVGNRTSVATTGSTNSSSNSVIPYLVDACNQYTEVGSLLVSSDQNGNLTSDQNGNTYSYDAQNRLVSATKGGITVTMTYDARNRVVSRSVNGDTETFVYDGWKLIEDYDSNGTEDAWYVNGPGADEILTRNPTIGETSYYTQDGNGNVTTITDAEGNVQERYSYDVYGTPTITDGAGNVLAVSGVGNRFLFTGREYISQIGVYDYRNRVYSPTLGRFLQTDPIRFNAGDVNIYRYCGNDPTDWIDPWGLLTSNRFSPNDPIHDWSDGFKSGDYDYGGHGRGPNGDRIFDDSKADGKGQGPAKIAKDVANDIAHDPNYHDGQGVTLMACSTGKGGDRSFAQKLANLLGVPVTAPLGNIMIDKNGNTKVGNNPVVNAGQSPKGNSGWHTYSPQ